MNIIEIDVAEYERNKQKLPTIWQRHAQRPLIDAFELSCLIAFLSSIFGIYHLVN
jgi:hypothetical protein